MPARGLLVILVIVSAAAAGWYFALGNHREPNGATVSGGITGALPPVQEPVPQNPDIPVFEIARIDSGGQAVISGHAVAGAKLTVFSNGKTLGQVTANNRGEWVFVGGRPLPSGSQEITASAVGPDGKTLDALGVVIVDVPPQGRPPLAVLQVPGQVSRLLQGADDGAATAPAISLVDYQLDGNFAISGRAAPRAKLRVYLDNEPFGVATVNSQGVWVLRPQGITPGAYTMRIDQLGPKGSVNARIEVPFERVNADLAASAMLGSGKLSVQTGHEQWRIARSVTGTASEYTVIYQANQGQIRDPNLIYPGQIFEQPEASAEE